MTAPLYQAPAQQVQQVQQPHPNGFFTPPAAYEARPVAPAQAAAAPKQSAVEPARNRKGPEKRGVLVPQ